MARLSTPRAVPIIAAAVGLLALVLVANRPRDEAAGDDPATPPAPAAAPIPASAVASPPAAPPRAAGELRVSKAGWATNFDIGNVDLSEIIAGGPGKDGIPALDEPRFESLSAARSWQNERAPVIALVIGGEARAYPLAILMWHEIVNDTLGGVPIVVTFCPLCNTALVFEREVDGVLYDFGTTGNLRYSDLVMYDRQTESWWQQATGQAIVGQLTGAPLPFVPSQIVSLGDFAAAHPTGIVLSRETGHARSYGYNPYLGYDTVDQNPLLFRGVIDGRLSPMERVVSVSIAGESVAYPYSELAKVGAVHDEIGDTPIVVFWQAGVNSALDATLIDEGRDVGATGVFSPLVDGRELSFQTAATAGPIVDAETGSGWTILGQATSGPQAGRQLEAIGHGDHFWFAWAAFEPETRIWTADE